ncbi:double zinc ribbon and ankyrin repeat-containing protein 1-like isoform X3 [Dysidea avara]|uniref:double zinc ribbon and ankyrin repeat-containing protein 1-like isoform X3 n=1 Tax=Dysidea avara TaxID=196820 RepID=UPI003319E81C
MTAGSISAPIIVPLKAAFGAKRNGSKYSIDQATPIAITSESKDIKLYYTINGTKPDPFQRSGHKYTYQYQVPFTLPAADKAVTIKAIAINNDGLKQSNVVTKTFFLKTAPDSMENMTSNNRASFSVASPSAYPVSPSLTGPQYLFNRLGPRLKSDEVASMPMGASLPSQSTPRVHAPSDYRICVYCNARRPEDLHAKYCPECGMLLPFLPTSQSEAQPTIGLSVCSSCRAMVPVGSTVCVVCEAPIDPPPRLPVINAQLKNLNDIKGKPVCLGCGTVNSSEMKICVTCEKPLIVTQAIQDEASEHRRSSTACSKLLQTTESGVYLLCSTCGRINASDARFCDWCGREPAGPQQPVTCSSCSATNSWEARHCVSCSAQLRPPTRHGMQITPSMKIPMADLVDTGGWVPLLDTTEEGPVTCEVATQTEGLFYPSSRTISKAIAASEVAAVSWAFKKPQIGVFSPGRGYWRQQLDHVCTHLKAYAQSCTDFQGAIGKPQIGKLLSATLHDEDNELNMHLTFELKPQHRGSIRTPSDHDPKLLSSLLANSSTSTILSEGSTINDTSSNKHRTRSRKKKKRKPVKDDLTLLVEELSSQGDEEKVADLLKKRILKDEPLRI